MAAGFYCIGDEDTARGFRLAGVAGRVVVTAAEAEAALDAAAALPSCGVIIIGAAAAKLARAKVERLRLEHARPLVVEI